ncbi:MAG: GNVR domain-containing protein [Pseudomonadota bacterium]|nr:GNVR domain-containing protein [Pseudomonadota bacterium]
MQAQEAISIDQVKGIIRRQRGIFIILFLLTWIAALSTAMLLPAIYRAESTILIEEQQIPQEFVQTTITSYVEERLQVITQQIMSRPRLQEIIDRFKLYPEMQKRHTKEEIISRLRTNISLQTISADVVDRRTGRPSTATIAFNLSYQGKNPGTVVKVTNRLTSLYLEENLRQREERVTNIATFLNQERQELAQFITKLEEQISLFKQQHGRELPEFNAVNLQAVNRLTRDLEQNRMQLRSLKERKLYLEGQIATIDPTQSSNLLRNDEGRLLLPPQEKLKALNLQLLTLKARYSDKHPDIKKTEREIAEIKAQNPDLAISADELTDKQEQLEKLQLQSKELQARLGDKHPDRIQVEKELVILRREIDNFTQTAQNQTAAGTLETTTINNPAYINLQVQIRSAAMEIAATEAAYQQTKKNLTDFQTRLENAPLVERDYKRMIRNLDQAQLRHTDITHKLTEAQVAQQMEESQQGERFKIIDPAQTPEKPFKPNRMAIALIGFVLALGLSTGVCALRENLDTSIKSVAELTRLTGVPVLSVTPIMENLKERRRRYWRYGLVTMLLLGLIIAALAAIHLFYLPLDILWIKVMRRIGI